MTKMKITNKEYHALESIGSSGLKLMAKSPKHFYSRYLDPEREQQEPTEAMQFGSLVHTLVLEPEMFANEYAVMPQGIDRRTNAGKALWNEWEDKNQGKTVIKQEAYDIACKVANSVLGNSAASLIKNRIGEPERTMIWTDSGIECKARLDWCVPPCDDFPNGIILDLKTTKDAGLDFANSAYNLGYHIQAAWYLHAFQSYYNVTDTPFIFIAAEKESPYGVMSYIAGQDFISAGLAECKRLLKLYSICKSENKWPCYSETITELNLPKWAKENYV